MIAANGPLPTGGRSFVQIKMAYGWQAGWCALLHIALGEILYEIIYALSI